MSCKCDTNRAGHFTLDAHASRPVACIVNWFYPGHQRSNKLWRHHVSWRKQRNLCPNGTIFDWAPWWEKKPWLRQNPDRIRQHTSAYTTRKVQCLLLTASGLRVAWNGNVPHITGPLWGESTGNRWIPFTKDQWCVAVVFSLLLSGLGCWIKSRRQFETLGCSRDVTVMMLKVLFCLCKFGVINRVFFSGGLSKSHSLTTYGTHKVYLRQSW